MRKVYFLLVLLLTGIGSSYAQLLPPNQPEQDACNALLLCGNTFTSTYSYQQEGLVNDLTATPCGGGEGNSMWLRLEITTGGIIVFTLTPLNGTDDYDFAIVDITNTDCSNFTSSNVIRCNFNNNQPGSNPGGIVGLNTTSTTQFTNAGVFGGSFLQQINANAGEVYLIMINNFGDPFVGGPSSGFTIDFTGSTAIFNDNGSPHMASVYQPCGNNLQLLVPISEKILCNSIEPSGTDFALSGGGVISAATGINCSGATGYTDTVVLTLASPLAPGNYSLSIQNGTDGNTIIDLCGHADTIPDVQNFIVNGSTMAYNSIVPPACYQFKVTTTSQARCNSIATDGSDFSISGPQSVSVISAAPVSCDASDMTDTILVTLSAPLITDGHYTLMAKTGSDGNTLIDLCGLSQPVGDTIGFDIYSYDGWVTAMPDTLVCNPGYINFYGTDISPQPATYQWTPGALLDDSTQLNTRAYINSSSDYTLLAIDKDGCPHRANTTVTLSERNPILSPLNATICAGETVALTASGGASYTWVAVDMNSLSCATCAATHATPLQTATYEVQITAEDLCTDTLFSVIEVNPLPDVIATPDDTLVKYGSDIQLTASGASFYTWSPVASVNYANSSAPMATITEPVVFIVTGIDGNGCGNSDTIIVNVDYRSPITLPNAFTPNGDGRNDVFRLGNIAYQKLQEFRIYNRWGQEVFSTTDPKKGWDGSYHGQPQEMGVYHYLIRLVTPGGGVSNYKGDVTLMR